MTIKTLGSLLRRRAEQCPTRLAFVFEDETGQTVEWTYAELDRRASAIASWLSGKTEVGQRALLVYPAGLDFIAAFFGCLYAGVLPVPATYPKPRRPSPRLDTIAADCDPSLVLTHSSVLGSLCLDQQSPVVAELAWEATDQLSDAPCSDFTLVERAGEDLAFLQYTSGSTSDPRGVMISHDNLLHNLEMIRQGFGVADLDAAGEVTNCVFWLPAYHDMGLIGGILSPIYAGGTSYLLAPTTFLRRPLRWLELLSETKAQFSGAPNFGFELLVKKTTPEQRESLDLSHWRLAFCGAEPIHPETMRKFATAFAPAGFCSDSFYPCYGMAEVTLLVTGGQRSRELQVLNVDRERLRQHLAVPVESTAESSQALVGCGAAMNGQTIAIVDPPTLTVCDDGRVGEIWVQGDSVARGYWNRETVNQEVFGAQLSGQTDSTYLRTGDLGFQLDGELYITGRLKDVVIIRGSNHYPQDIERTTVDAHQAVGMGAAFAVTSEREERLVVVHQVNREHRKADFEEVLHAVRTAIVAEHDLEPQAIVLIKPVGLPITSSGKVQRQRCREQYLQDELQVLATWTAGDENSAVEKAESVGPPEFLPRVLELEQSELAVALEPWLIRWLTARADLKPGAMQSTTPFAELGLDSLTAVEISLELDKVLELMLPPMLIWGCPSCDKLAELLAEELVANRKGERPNPFAKSTTTDA